MHRAPRITITERPAGSGRYSIRWRENGKQREERGYPTPEEADARRFQIEARFRRGLPGTRTRITIRDLVARWWDDYVLTLQAASIANYRTSATRILDTIGNADASSFTPPRISAWRDELEAMLGSPRLVNECLKVLSGAYQRGIEWGIVEDNPVRGVPRLAEPDRPFAVPTREQVAALGITAPNISARARLCVAAGTGLRPGEQLALEWRHITDTTIRVEQALKLNGRIGSTKTGSARMVPLPTPVRDVLDQWRTETRFDAASDPVFASPHGRFSNPSRFRTEVWYPWRIEAGCDGLDWRTLRHYYAAAVASAGGTMLQASRWMGHSTIATTAKRYAFLFDDDAWVVMERLG